MGLFSVSLLSILRTFHPELPTDARTVLKTQTHVSTIKMEGREYYHFGLAKGIVSRLKSLILSEQLQTVKLQFNLDGLPLFKSCTLQFWPILAIVNCDYAKHPFLVGLYCGMKKPKCIFEFLKPFIDDLAVVLLHGIVYNGRNILYALLCVMPLPEPLLKIQNLTMATRAVTNVFKWVSGKIK